MLETEHRGFVLVGAHCILCLILERSGVERASGGDLQESLVNALGSLVFLLFVGVGEVLVDDDFGSCRL